MTRGTVYLVGAGPGNPGLVTFRAKELIASADVVVYDCPVHRDLLGWCRPDCEKIDVGQRPSSPARPPEEIESLLVARAKAGRSVVRLQSGDPFVFGRGGEEVRRLAADGIPFEVVPGIPAAVAILRAEAGKAPPNRASSATVSAYTATPTPSARRGKRFCRMREARP